MWAERGVGVAILGILGTILKIIGIILLCILFLLLFILCLLLFVPLRYRAQFFREGKNLALHAQVSYLFRLIYLPVDVEDKKLKISLKVFGFTLFTNAGGGGGKKKKAAKKGKKKASDKEGEREENGEGKEQTDPPTSTDQIKENQKESQSEANQIEENQIKESQNEASQIKENQNEENRIKGSQNEASQIEKARNEESQIEEARSGESRGQESPIGQESLNEIPEAECEAEEEILIRRRKHRSIPEKIARKLRILYKKIVVVYQKIRRSIRNILEKISFGKEKLADLREKIKLIFTFLRDEQNKNGIKYAGKSILQLLKYVLPYKIEGELVFATGDAYSMGKALSILGMLYPLYGKQLMLTADFESDKFRLDGRVQLAGRIRFCRILWIAFKLWRKGKILTLVSSAKELKHKLTTSAL